MLDGIQITILQVGVNKNPFGLIILIISRIIVSAALKSAITPSFSGRMVFRLSCVFSCICMAFFPTATTLLVSRFMATIEGSSTTTLSLWIMTVLAVPRSIAISWVKKLNNFIGVSFLFHGWLSKLRQSSKKKWNND